jgi:hypothetical protein
VSDSPAVVVDVNSGNKSLSTITTLTTLTQPNHTVRDSVREIHSWSESFRGNHSGSESWMKGLRKVGYSGSAELGSESNVPKGQGKATKPANPTLGTGLRKAPKGAWKATRCAGTQPELSTGQRRITQCVNPSLRITQCVNPSPRITHRVIRCEKFTPGVNPGSRRTAWQGREPKGFRGRPDSLRAKVLCRRAGWMEKKTLGVCLAGGLRRAMGNSYAERISLPFAWRA